MGGDDTVIIDATYGNPFSAGGISIDGGAGANVVALRSLPASTDLAASDTEVEWADSVVAYSNATVELGVRSIDIGSAPAVTEFKSLTLTGSAKVQIAAAGQTKDQVLFLSGLNIASGAQLDVRDNSIILKGVSDTVAKAQELMNKVNTGRTGAANAWEGPGIISSNAKADELLLTTVGVLDNNFEGAAFIEYYYGVALDANTVVLKYTYFGDTNLDGEITGSDYAVTDLAYWLRTPTPGWRNGDCNGDGVVDGSDYAIMDLAFWMQEAGKPLAAEAPSVVDAGAAVVSPPSWSSLPINPPRAAVEEEQASFLTDEVAVLA